MTFATVNVLPEPGDAQENLMLLALFELTDDGVYRLGLIARGREFRMELEATHEGSLPPAKAARKIERKKV